MIAGIRTCSFEEGTLYWHEGLEEWKPVHGFPGFAAGPATKGRHRVMPGELPAAPTLPATNGPANSPRKRPRRSRASQPSSRRLGRRGRAIFFGIVVVAVLLTVGILLLLMQF